jgi:hypothetical protein
VILTFGKVFWMLGTIFTNIVKKLAMAIVLAFDTIFGVI